MANHTSHASLPYPIRNARYSIGIPYLDADGDPTDPTTPDTEVSKDAGAYADCAEEVTTISGSNGSGYITLSGAETDCALLFLAAKVASGPKNTLATLYPRNLPIISSGTLSAGSAGGGTLGTALGYDITGCFIRTTGGTGGGGTGGANNQARRIITYTQSTGAFTVSPNWETTPSTDTTYDILLPDGAVFGALKALNPTTAGRTLDVTTGGEAGLDFSNVNGTLDNAEVGTDLDVYQAQISLDRDTIGTTDRWIALWLKNGQAHVSGITSPDIWVYTEGGTDLIGTSGSPASMTEIGSTQTFKYDATGAERITAGVSYVARVRATIGGSTRTWYQAFSRDT